MISPLNLSQFEIIKKVGEGGFGKVYEIKNKTSGKIFAAKVALFSLKNESKDMIRNLSREVNIISKLNHPSIVQFIGYSPFNFKGEPHPVIVTEFLPNGSLNDILNLERRGLCDVGWNDTKKIINIYGIAFAMSYLHSNNIIHRDLKPDNILMDEYLLPKLTDFGLSKVKHTNEETITLQSTATIKGTPIYIAPEIWATCMYSKECDVYAFAFIVYEIMTLEVPYKDYDYFGLMTNVLNGIRPEIIGVPECYKNLIEKCWDQNPSNRPTFDQIVYELKNNDDYITDLIEEEDFRQYIEYIEKFITSFNSKNHISITEFIDHETKTFQKIVIDKKIISKLKKDEEEEDDDDDYEEDEESTTSNSEEKPKKEKNKKIDINIKKKELPFQIPPDDDPSVTRYRELLYGKLIKLPKEIIPQSLFTYASLTEYGNVFPKNYREANIFYKIACDMGHVDSMWHYAVLLERGQGTEKNTKEADKYFQMAIEKGSVDAMTTYGAFLISRKNSSDQKKGIYYYKMGADNGDIVAMHDLGVLFSDGIVVKKDQNKALYFHKMAAKKGYLKSMHKISLIYQIGDGIPVDLEKAFNYMKLAANTGDAESINSVGWMYENGTGISKNIKKAIKYYNMAIEKGNTNAMVNYGSILYNTKEEKKIKQALQLFEKAADLNNTKALTNLHAMYNQGLGVTLNKEKALEYLQKAVDLGDIIAIRLMGIKYKQGDGVPVDLTKGFEYYKMAADKGSTDDMFLVGLDLKDGSGVEKNTEEALKYFKRGADLNNVACMVAYADIYNSGNDVPRNEEEAIKYYSMAKDKNDKTAYERLGCILLNKDRNSKEGIDYLKKAASLGDIDAMSELAELYQDNDERPQEDFDQSLCYSMQAYSNGNTNAMNYIYNLVLKKKIQQDNIPLAIEFVKKAADLGDTTAMVVYVTYLTNNCEPTPEVLNDQVHYAKLAADNGNSQGMVCYAVLLQNGLGIKKNIPEAIHYYKMAADLGNPVGQFFYNQYNRVLSEDEANQIRNNVNQLTSQLTNMVKELGEVLKKHNINLKDFQNNPVNNSQNNPVNNSQNNPVNDSQNTPVNDSNLNDNNNNDDDSISSNLSIDSNDNLDRNITTYKNTNRKKNIVPQKNTNCAKKHSCCFSFTITFFVACCIALFVYLLYYFVFS